MLARADSTDFTLTNLTLVFCSLLIIAIASFLGFLIYRAARLHRRAQAEGFAALAILWAIIAAGAAIHDMSVQSKWSHEAADRLRSGYYTPAEVNADAPRHPVPLFIALAAAYPLLLLLASRPILYGPAVHALTEPGAAPLPTRSADPPDPTPESTPSNSLPGSRSP